MSTAAPATPTLGVFCWHELYVPEPDRAAEFYAALLGWSCTAVPMGPFTYRALARGGTGFGGIMDTSGPEWQGMPPHWMGYVSVPNVDAAAQRAVELGGAVRVPPTDIPNTGRFAIIADAGGAALAIFDGGGGPAGAEKGAIAWNELLARDVDGAVSFYGALFGWTAQTMPMAHGPYTVLMQGGTPVGGIMSLETLNLPSVPPHWMHYLLVDDVDAALAKAESMGGKVCTPGTSIPGVGRFAIFNDPVGTHTAIFSK